MLGLGPDYADGESAPWQGRDWQAGTTHLGDGTHSIESPDETALAGGSDAIPDGGGSTCAGATRKPT